MDPRKLMYLSSVSDISVPTSYTYRTSKISTQMKECKLTFLPGAQNSVIAKKLRYVTPMKIKVWLNTVSKHKRLVSIDIEKELMYRDTSDGKQCPLSITSAIIKTTMNDSEVYTVKEMSVIVKFRNTVHDSKITMTEIEGQHAVNTAMNEDLKELFPYLYFIFTIDSSWECVGTEKMNEITYVTPEVLVAASGLLEMLHSLDYAHCDAHSGNFMKIPHNSNHIVLNKERIIMIDQDRIRAIPPESKNKVLRNYMIVQDLNMLLFWNNPFINFFHGLSNHEIEIFSQLLYLIIKKKHFWTPPWGFHELNQAPPDTIMKYLNKRENIEYYKLLQTTTSEEIYSAYNSLFSSSIEMKNFNKDLNSARIKILEYQRM
jgi:hypothetical protein